jgi:hypothetical protein
MRVPVAWCVALTWVFAAAPARSQMLIHPWVEGRYLQDRDKTWDHVVRTGPGGSVAAGVDLSRRFGIEGSVDWPEAHVLKDDWTYYTLSGRMRTRTTITYRAPAVSVFATAHLVTTSRVRVTFLAGLAKFWTPTRDHTLTEQLAADGKAVIRDEHEDRDNYSHGGMAFGVEVPLRLARGLSIVPSVHSVFVPLADYGRNGFVRPSIGMRWTFSAPTPRWPGQAAPAAASGGR